MKRHARPDVEVLIHPFAPLVVACGEHRPIALPFIEQNKVRFGRFANGRRGDARRLNGKQAALEPLAGFDAFVRFGETLGLELRGTLAELLQLRALGLAGEQECARAQYGKESGEDGSALEHSG